MTQLGNTKKPFGTKAVLTLRVWAGAVLAALILGAALYLLLSVVSGAV